MWTGTSHWTNTAKILRGCGIFVGTWGFFFGVQTLTLALLDPAISSNLLRPPERLFFQGVSYLALVVAFPLLLPVTRHLPPARRLLLLLIFAMFLICLAAYLLDLSHPHFARLGATQRLLFMLAGGGVGVTLAIWWLAHPLVDTLSEARAPTLGGSSVWGVARSTSTGVLRSPPPLGSMFLVTTLLPILVLEHLFLQAPTSFELTWSDIAVLPLLWLVLALYQIVRSTYIAAVAERDVG